MMILYKKIIVCTSVILLMFANNLNGQDLMDYSNSRKYADYLFNNKQYNFSVIEYDRITFLEPNDTLAKLRLIQSYRLLDDCSNAKAALERYFPQTTPNYPEVFAVENFRILLHEQQYQKAYLFLQENQTIMQPAKMEYELGTLLMQNSWDKAKVLSDDYRQMNINSNKLDSLTRIAIYGHNLKYKNPYYAALFSTLIPGSGKVFTKQWQDGIYAFLIVSTFSVLTYKSVQRYGWNGGSLLYGTIALSFYSANIYGSFKSAKRYNHRLNNNLTKNIEEMMNEE